MVPIRLEKLTKRFHSPRGSVAAVSEVSLEIRGGELFFLLGPSGCGKTTLLRMLAGFVQPDSGRVFFGATEVTHLPPEKRDAAMVFQNYALWPHMTVAKNVSFGPEVRKVPRAEREKIVAELLETVRIAEKASVRPMALSGGQQQRVALARALAVRPKCLLLDEPLSNLDASLRAAMRWEIRRIVKSSGTTTVYVTHDQDEALAIADRIALMRDGRIVQIGTGRELYERPASRFVAAFLGEANFVEATVLQIDPADPDGNRFALLETPLGKLRATAGEALERGREVTCCIRPEALSLAPGQGDSGTAENTFAAELLEWVHLGDSARFRVRLAGGLELSGAAMPARPRAELGRVVLVRIPPEDVAVVTA